MKRRIRTRLQTPDESRGTASPRVDRVVRSMSTAAAAGAAGGAVAFGTWGAAAGLALGPASILVAARRRKAARGEELEAAFPEAVRSMADAVRAGGNVQQALERAADEASPAMREELMRVSSEIGVGVPIERALDEFADRCRVPGTRVLAIALTSAVRSGADVRPVLDCIVEAASDRRRFRRELRASTAQGRMTALVIGALPGAFLLIMGAGGGSELTFLFREPLGWTLVAIGVLLELAGFAWIRRLGRPA